MQYRKFVECKTNIYIKIMIVKRTLLTRDILYEAIDRIVAESNLNISNLMLIIK